MAHPYAERDRATANGEGLAYVYAIRAPSDNAYFYIGSTRTTPKARFDHHKTLARQGKHYNRHLMHKLLQVGLDLAVLEVIAVCSVRDQFDVEHAFIAEYIKNGHPLTNIKLTPEVPSRSAQESYVDFVTDPGRLLSGVRYLRSGPYKSATPGMQSIADRLHEVSLRLIDRAEQLLGCDIEDHLEAVLRAKTQA